MAEKKVDQVTLPDLLREIRRLQTSLCSFETEMGTAGSVGESLAKRFVRETGALVADLHRVREWISPVRFGAIGITLGRSDGIAKFFAFSFVSREKKSLAELIPKPFYGAGVYALYYRGKSEKAYRPLSGTETPIYVGKADPADPQAETVEEQGQALYRRLRDHCKSMTKANLPLKDFQFRAAPIQTGMQGAVEDFMIRLFLPIWNKEVKICYGIGKHGDSASTRGNKRSPWDTMHPGRKWAAATKMDQMSRKEIMSGIASHLAEHPPIRDKDQLFKLLSLD